VRRGVALLLTMLFVAAAMAAGLYYVQMRQRALQTLPHFRSIAQNTLLLSDLERLLARYKKIGEDELDALFVSTPYIASEDGKFMVALSVSNLQNRVNINLIANRAAKQYLNLMLYNIASTYEIYDPQLLADIILDSIDTDLRERTPDGEIALEDRNFQNGPIRSIERFWRILGRYYDLTGDSRVFLPPWERIFVFGERLDLIVDCVRITSEAKRALGFGADDDLCRLAKSKEYAAMAKALQIQNFSKKRSYIIQVKASYQIGTLAQEAVVGYDIAKGSIEYVR